MNGHRYTDATFLRHGTMATDISGHAYWWQYLPGYKRALYFRVPTMAMPAVAAAAVLEPRPTAWAASIVTTLAVPAVSNVVRGHRFRVQVAEPVARTVAKVTKERVQHGRGHRAVDIPMDFRDNPEAKIVVRLPMDWVADKGDMARLVDAVSKKLALDEPVASWTLAGHQPFVTLSMPAKPPTEVTFLDMLPAADNCSDTELVMGVGPRSGLVSFSLKTESPHLAIAGGTGAGKSELLAWLVGQLMRRGYGVACLDAKFTSHMWLRRIPGVLYASEAEELHEALLWLDGELLRRARFVAAGGDPKTLQPMVVVLEEMNGATNRLRQYWATIKGSGDPMMSPALTGLGNLSSMGRELMMHIFMAGQSLTGKATAGPENRENFGGRTLARATANQWRMLAPQIKPAPTKRQAPGRWHLVVGDSLREYQAPYVNIKDEESRLIGWATGGAPVVDVVAMMLGADRVVVDEREETPWSEATTCTLPEYAASAGTPLKRLENWRSQRPDFPASAGRRGQANLYERADLDAFVAARVS